MKQYEVLLIIEAFKSENLHEFEAFLAQEGFNKIEDFTYQAMASLPLMNTKIFILETMKEAFKIAKVSQGKFIYQLAENPPCLVNFKEQKS